jgi:hypothetical protein
MLRCEKCTKPMVKRFGEPEMVNCPCEKMTLTMKGTTGPKDCLNTFYVYHYDRAPKIKVYLYSDNGEQHCIDNDTIETERLFAWLEGRWQW